MTSPVGPYSPIVRAGEWLVCSGQVGISEGALVAGGVEAEARQALANLRALLEAEGSSMDAVVKTTMFLTDAAAFASVNLVYAEAFGAHRPARSTVVVLALPLGAAVEIEAWARSVPTRSSGTGRSDSPPSAPSG